MKRKEKGEWAANLGGRNYVRELGGICRVFVEEGWKVIGG